MRAVVKDNMDLMGLGRVQVTLAGYPDVEPWAAVASPFAGSDYGLYAMPQIGDEVIVGFERGDALEPFVVGGMWSAMSMPPAGIPQTDPQYKRVLKTPNGHLFEFDDLEQSITLKTTTDQEITLTPDEIKISVAEGAASITISLAGEVTIKATTQISMSAPAISLDAEGSLKLSGAAVSVEATGTCSINGGMVTIN
jgi:uncharacterized protein involved in type VI secretion and phage assembly